MGPVLLVTLLLTQVRSTGAMVKSIGSAVIPSVVWPQPCSNLCVARCLTLGQLLHLPKPPLPLLESENNHKMYLLGLLRGVDEVTLVT